MQHTQRQTDRQTDRQTEEEEERKDELTGILQLMEGRGGEGERERERERDEKRERERERMSLLVICNTRSSMFTKSKGGFARQSATQGGVLASRKVIFQRNHSRSECLTI